METKQGVFLKTQEILNRLNVSKATLNRMIRNSEYPACTIPGRPNLWLEDVHLQWVNSKFTPLQSE